MNTKRVSPSSVDIPISSSKRALKYDSTKINDIVTLLSDEVEILEKILYIQRNSHRRSSYFKSTANLTRYCHKIVIYTKDILSHINEYKPDIVADGLLQVCNLIYKAVKQGQNCSKNNMHQLAYQFYIRICTTCLSSSCRLVELCLMLLEEIVPIQQKATNCDPSLVQMYSIPPSILDLLLVNSASTLSTDVNNSMEIETIDDDMFAVYSCLF